MNKFREGLAGEEKAVLAPPGDYVGNEVFFRQL